MKNNDNNIKPSGLFDTHIFFKRMVRDGFNEVRAETILDLMSQLSVEASKQYIANNDHDLVKRDSFEKVVANLATKSDIIPTP